MSVIPFPGRGLPIQACSNAHTQAAAAKLVDFPIDANAAIVNVAALLETSAALATDESITLTFQRGARWTFEVALETASRNPADALALILHSCAPRARFQPASGVSLPRFALRLVPRGDEVVTSGRVGAPDLTVGLMAESTMTGDIAAVLALADKTKVDAIRVTLRPRHLDFETQVLIGGALHRLQQHPWVTRRTAQLAATLSAWADARSGISFDVCAYVAVPITDDVANALCIALFGAASDPLCRHTLDLRLSTPRSTLPTWRFCPTPSDLRKPRPRPAACNIDEPGSVVLGLDGADEKVVLSSEDRTRHFYIVGGTGTGKTTLIRGMLMHDIARGQGIMLIDPHGDLANLIRASVPVTRQGDVICLDPSDDQLACRLDLFGGDAARDETARDRLANQIVWFLRNLYQSTPEAFGPIFELYLRNALFLLMVAEKPADRSLLNIENVFLDQNFRHRLARTCGDAKVAQFWMSCADETSGEQSLANIAPYIVSKFTQLTGSPQVRRFLGGSATRLDLRRAMDDGRIVIVSLAKGDIGEYAARFLGALCLMQVSGDAMSRSDVDPSARRPFRLYVDEFQTLATRFAADILAECRKYNLSMTLANQSLAQIGGDRFSADIAQATLANCGTIAAFRVGPYDAAMLAPFFGAASLELPSLTTGEFLVRRLNAGAPMPPQLLQGLDPSDQF